MDLKKLMSTKQGLGTPQAVVSFLVGITVVFILVANLVPVAQTQGDTINTSGLPLGSLFGATGVIFILVMVAVFVAIMRKTGLGGKR